MLTKSIEICLVSYKPELSFIQSTLLIQEFRWKITQSTEENLMWSLIKGTVKEK